MKIANELLNDQFSSQPVSQLNITPHLHSCQGASLNMISKVGFVSEPEKKNPNANTLQRFFAYVTSIESHFCLLFYVIVTLMDPLFFGTNAFLKSAEMLMR